LADSGRRTIRTATQLTGTGLHFGASCTLRFEPAAPGQGIVFERFDRPELPSVPATVEHAVVTERRTQIGKGDAAFHTVEHVLAAVSGLEIDDITIRMDASEPPILDGSALPFVEALSSAGLAMHGGRPAVLALSERVHVIDGDSVYDAYPAPVLSLEVTIEFPHPLIGRQTGSYSISRDAFVRDLAPARTFGFTHEVEELRGKGLIQGASTENTVVLDESGVVGGALRFPDEFLRHKAMDCVGDLALAGSRVRARIVAHKPSHRGTVTLVREMTRAAGQKISYGIEEIMKILPHRYPFLLVDRIIEAEGDRIVGIKNVTINEPFFQGHFPGHPIMPGVLILEAMAQIGGILLVNSVENKDNKVVYFMSLDNVKFRRPVKPGDQLRCELVMTQVRNRTCRMKGVATVDGEVVAEAEMAAIVRDK
jgi:UDP-3-O-[3-hydroxymyristoyl] N-acetylglucosamine deacetylase/3-hydroxyacyl-[acyl-carrier-protein] dehydratase